MVVRMVIYRVDNYLSLSHIIDRKILYHHIDLEYPIIFFSCRNCILFRTWSGNPWQLVFIVGIYFSKFGLFEKINPKYLHLMNSIMIVFICLLLRRRGAPDFILVTPLIMSSISIFNKSRYLKTIMIFLGRYSFPMWLIHTFFCYYYFQRFIYWPKISILVLLNLLFITIVVVFLTEALRTRFMKLLPGNISH